VMECLLMRAFSAHRKQAAQAALGEL